LLPVFTEARGSDLERFKRMNRVMLWLKVRQRAFVQQIMAILFPLCFSSIAHASDGYRVSGCLTYTLPSPQGQPFFREILLFQIRVLNTNWLVHVEPLRVGRGGIAYWEDHNTADGGVQTVTAFVAASNESPNSLASLRAKLEYKEADEIAAQVPPLIPAHISSAALSTNDAVTKIHRINNVATEDYFADSIPPTDSSFASMLWFAFVLRRQDLACTNEQGNLMLPQIWPDAFRPSVRRFHRAEWETFPGNPQLLRVATFDREGVMFGPDGGRERIVSGPNGPTPEALYTAGAVSNISGFYVPMGFALKRFQVSETATAAGSIQPILCTFGAEVYDAEPLKSSATVLSPSEPGYTYVQDYRLAASETHGRPVSYVTESNQFPTVDQLKTNRFYPALASIQPSPLRESHSRWLILVALAFLPALLVAILYRRRLFS
jgi:hypothetical protein